MPKIKARFRKYLGVPFAIEQLTGVQYHCRACNQVFLRQSEFDRHLRSEAKKQAANSSAKECPQANLSTLVTVLFTRDVYDQMRKDFLHLPEGVTYDPDP
jgi:hypothetical protein